MPEKVGKIPDFAEETEGEKELAKGNQEVKETEEESSEEEKETLAQDASGAEKPVSPLVDDDISKDKDAAILGLEMEKNKLLTEIQKLRGTRRDLRQQTEEEPKKDLIVEKKEISDEINPQDREIIKKVIEQEGYVKKEETQALIHKDVEQQQLADWLESHPEFKIENDPMDRNWNALMNEYKLYVKPKDPSQTKEFLNRAFKAIPSYLSSNGQNANESQTKQQKLETAGMGGGGIARPSSSRLSIPSGLQENEAREEYRRGGYTEEEIDELLINK